MLTSIADDLIYLEEEKELEGREKEISRLRVDRAKHILYVLMLEPQEEDVQAVREELYQLLADETIVTKNQWKLEVYDRQHPIDTEGEDRDTIPAPPDEMWEE